MSPRLESSPLGDAQGSDATNCGYLYEHTAHLTRDQRRWAMAFLIGYLAPRVDQDEWRRAVDCATACATEPTS